MTHRMASVVALVGVILLLMNGQAIGQVTGSGTPGTVPVWTGDGTVLTDSSIQDNGTVVNVSATVQVVDGGSTGFGVAATTSSQDGAGVLGRNFIGFGVAGWSLENGIYGGGVGATGRLTGIAARSANCDMNFQNCVPGSGTAGLFFTGTSGLLLEGQRWNSDLTLTEVFRVDASGNLTVAGDAFKPGGGSWSTLSDRRAKKSIEPITGALNQILKLHGVTYEYANPSAFSEMPGIHLGMVAQDVEQVFPSWVDTGKDGYKRLTFRGFEAVAVEAVRELDSNSKEAMARIEDLERQNAELREAIEVLSETVKSLQQK